MGLEYIDCLETQNGVTTLNIQKFKELAVAEQRAEVATLNLARATLALQLPSIILSGDSGKIAKSIEDMQNYTDQINLLNSEITGFMNFKGEGDKTPESIKSFKTLEAKYQNYVNMKKMSEEDFMKWYDTAYKKCLSWL